MTTLARIVATLSVVVAANTVLVPPGEPLVASGTAASRLDGPVHPPSEARSAASGDDLGAASGTAPRRGGIGSGMGWERADGERAGGGGGGGGPADPSISGRDSSPSVTGYVWPSGREVAVLRDFAPPDVRWGAGHRGVDLDVSPGDAVVAAGDGVVAFAGMVAGRPVISIDHDDGVRTTYEPVEAVVTAGQAVAAGEVIGVLIAGHEPCDCLHWGARVARDEYIDPMSLLEDIVIRLYPVSVRH